MQITQTAVSFVFLPHFRLPCVSALEERVKKVAAVFFVFCHAAQAAAVRAFTYYTFADLVRVGCGAVADVAMLSFQLFLRAFHGGASTSENLALLAKVRKECHDPALVATLDKVKSAVGREIVELGRSYELHTLHHDITVIGDKLGIQHKAFWTAFLKGLHGMSVYYPDGHRSSLDLSVEMDRSKGKKIVYRTEKLSVDRFSFYEDCKQLECLERECFVKTETFSAGSIVQIMQKQGGFCYLARELSSLRIIGFVWGVQEKDTAQIYGVGRRAGCARLGVAESLLESALKDRNGSVFLHVRESNIAARALYHKMGFKILSRSAGYYSFPREDAIVMHWQVQPAAHAV